MKSKQHIIVCCFIYQHSVGMLLSVEAIFNAKACIPLGMHLLLELSVAVFTERCIPNGMRMHTLRADSTERCIPNGMPFSKAKLL